jgi:hypothetical protein
VSSSGAFPPPFPFVVCTARADDTDKLTARMVAEAAKPKKKQAPPSAATQAALNRAHEARHGHTNGDRTPSPPTTAS